MNSGACPARVRRWRCRLLAGLLLGACGASCADGSGGAAPGPGPSTEIAEGPAALGAAGPVTVPGGAPTPPETATTSSAETDPTDDGEDYPEEVYLDLEQELGAGRFANVERLLLDSELTAAQRAPYEAAAAIGLGKPVSEDTKTLVETAAEDPALPEPVRARAKDVLQRLAPTSLSTSKPLTQATAPRAATAPDVATTESTN